VQLVKAKDATIPLLIGPAYARFEINDRLFVIDTATDQAKSDNKEWAALAHRETSGSQNAPQPVFHSRFMFIRHIFIPRLELNLLESIPVERESRRGASSLKNRKLCIDTAVFPR
jgi:hypothetical protein